jgi:hypothetical protein
MSTITKDTVQNNSGSVSSTITTYTIPTNAESQLIAITNSDIICRVTLVDVQPTLGGARLMGQLVQNTNNNPIQSNYNYVGYGIDAGGNDGFGSYDQSFISFWPNNRATPVANTGVFGTIEIYNNHGDISLTSSLGAPYAWGNRPFLDIQSIGLSQDAPIFGLSGLELRFTDATGNPAYFQQGTIVVETFQLS